MSRMTPLQAPKEPPSPPLPLPPATAAAAAAAAAAAVLLLPSLKLLWRLLCAVAAAATAFEVAGVHAISSRGGTAYQCAAWCTMRASATAQFKSSIDKLSIRAVCRSTQHNSYTN
jgi:hypothetical protein